jgi:hypothetical protein
LLVVVFGLKTRNGPPTKLDYGPAHGSSYAGEEEIVDHHSVDDFLFIHLFFFDFTKIYSFSPALRRASSILSPTLRQVVA